MSNFDNTNTGAAFLKDNANPKAPKYAGPLNVDGKDYEISIWEKTSKAGKAFLSLKVGLPRPKGLSAHNQSKANGYAPQGEEEIPF
jgi:hypothetical protein